MPLFAFEAIDRDGGVVRGQLEALGRGQAIARLHLDGHIPLRLDAAAVAPAAGWLSWRWSVRKTLTARAQAELIERLAALVVSGLPLEESLRLIGGSDERAALRETARRLADSVRAGRPFADALASDPSQLPPIAVGMIRAGEASGALGPVLEKLAAYLRRTREVRESVRSALLYPVILLLTATGSVGLILLWVLPELRPLLQGVPGTLPLPARLAFGASDLVRDWWWLGPIVALSGLLGGRAVQREASLRSAQSQAVLRLPILGRLIRQIETARFARIMSAMLAGGVALPAALGMARPVAGNLRFAQTIEGIEAGVREGRPLAAEIAASGLFPDLAQQMVRIGERTGKLDALLGQLADSLERDVRQSIDRMLTVLTPALTLGLGALVGSIIASVMLALLSVDDLVR